MFEENTIFACLSVYNDDNILISKLLFFKKKKIPTILSLMVTGFNASMAVKNSIMVQLKSS